MHAQPTDDASWRFFDTATQPDAALRRPEDIGNAAFRLFASRLAMRVDAGSVALTVVRIPLVTSGDRAMEPAPALDPGPDAPCLISSPWAEIAASPGPKAKLRAVARFSERQILQDRAVLADLTTQGAAPGRPLTRSAFDHWARLYSRTERTKGQDRPAPEGIPPDLLWLFRAAPQSTRGPFGSAATGKMRALAEAAAPRYADLTAALLRLCADGAAGQHRISTIRDAGAILPDIETEHYQLD